LSADFENEDEDDDENEKRPTTFSDLVSPAVAGPKKQKIWLRVKRPVSQ